MIKKITFKKGRLSKIFLTHLNNYYKDAGIDPEFVTMKRKKWNKAH